MLLVRLWNYIRGYVIILVEGYFLEKFINICIHRQIFLWEVKRSSNGKMTLKVSINGFKLLRPIAKKTNCRVRILKKRGLPFVMNRYRNRKTFVLGAFVFLFLFYILTSFIWTVEITGNKNLENEFLMSKLSSFGVKTGTLKYGINPDQVVTGMMLEVRELAWIAVVVKGTKVKVSLTERTEPPAVLSDAPCDIIAARDGVIKSIITKTGQESVKVGDTVVKGQLLISGRVDIKNDETRKKLVHAMGSVMARTWYEGNSPVEAVRVEKERSGNTKDNYSLVLFNKRINLFHGKVSFEDYDRVEIRKRLSIGEDMVLPFELVIDRYYENNITEIEVDLEEAKKLAADEAYTEAASHIPDSAEIIKSNINIIDEADGGLTANVTIECVENIGVTKEIGGE